MVREFMDRQFTVRTGTVVVAVLAPFLLWYHAGMLRKVAGILVEEIGKTVDANS